MIRATLNFNHAAAPVMQMEYMRLLLDIFGTEAGLKNALERRRRCNDPKQEFNVVNAYATREATKRWNLGPSRERTVGFKLEILEPYL